MTALPSTATRDDLTRVIGLETQFSRDIIGLPIVDPLLTWTIASSRPDAIQVGYEISSIDELGAVTTSTPVTSSEQIEVVAQGHVSKAQRITYLRVRIATQYGWSDYSPLIAFETGLASGNDLVGRAIGDDSLHSAPSPILRKEFSSTKAVAKARIYATSEGIHSLYLNGVNVTDEYFTPGWTAYDDRNTYLTYDVTKLVQNGTNALAAELADGWHRGKFGFMNIYDNYTTTICLLAQLEITYTDGSKDVVATDESWKVSTGEIQFGDIYDGSHLDFTKEQKGWKLAGFNDASWAAPRIHTIKRENLEPRVSTRVLEVAEFPARILDSNKRTLIDFSQNISGWVRLVVDGKKGDIVTIRHAEVLEEGPNLHTAALRTAKATDIYTLGYDGRSVIEPKFTFHGFQFAEVTGPATFISATGVAISSANERRGFFTSSDVRLNRLHENVVWSIHDNMVSVPTDCPQRDERLGWTGDAQAIAMTANTIFKIDSFWRSWLTDLWVDQQRVGGVGAVVPDILSKQPSPAEGAGWVITDRAGWADAATIVPMATYESYGSASTLKQQVPSIRAYVESLSAHRKGEKFLPEEFQFGDWCDPDAPVDQPWLSKVKAQFVANAFFANTVEIAADVEALVGDAAQEKKFRELAATLKRDIWEHFGQEAKETTAGCSIAIEFGIVPESERAEVAKILSDKVIADQGKITTGFLGTPLILHALSKNGHFDAAYTMLMRRKVRSWLYQVDQKATTIWERWDAIREDGSIHKGEMATSSEEQPDASMISFNHYAYGAVIDWVYRNVAGIAPTAKNPGYRHITFAPRPGEGFTYASASVNTPLGSASISWEILDAGSLAAKIVVPFGSRAVIDFPATSSSTLHLNGATVGNGVEVGHGTYEVTLTAPAVATFKVA
ncbi:MAG: family 78 glycoside hydrolase catalytic domain [Candidatus Planktophila sp.]|nr:family 78 glycoside hydrolase catalytic domain [Candidatus Planktophila sp.]